MRSPTQRSLKYLRDRSYIADVSEHWNPFAKRRKDLFGFIDIVGIGYGHLLAVQTTTGSNVSERVKKISKLPAAKAWLRSGNEIEIHGWRKLKKGRVKWQPKVYCLVLSSSDDFVLQDLSFLS